MTTTIVPVPAPRSTLSVVATHTVPASLQAVWDVLGDFGTEHRWTRSVQHCERDTDGVGVGTWRTCTLPRPLMGRTSAREVLTEFEPGRALAYRLEGAAGPFLDASSRWSTTPAATGETLLTVEGRFTPRNRWVRWLLWPLASVMVRRLMRQVMRELGAFVVARTGGAGTQQPR